MNRSEMAGSPPPRNGRCSSSLRSARVRTCSAASSTPISRFAHLTRWRQPIPDRPFDRLQRFHRVDHIVRDADGRGFPFVEDRRKTALIFVKRRGSESVRLRVHQKPCVQLRLEALREDNIRKSTAKVEDWRPPNTPFSSRNPCSRGGRPVRIVG